MENNEILGVVTEAMPNTLFRVYIEDKDENVIAYLAGKMIKNRIKVLVGDKVSLVYDSTGGKSRIIRRK